MKLLSESKAFARVAVAIPILAILLAVAQAQWNRFQGQRWSFPLQAFDPRDILRGKYLNVRFKHELDPGCEGEDCCICFADADFGQDPPKLTTRSCQSAKHGCESWLRVDAMQASYRYFIPEAQSAALEAKVIKATEEGRARVEFVLDAKHRPQITRLTVDGQPILP